MKKRILFPLGAVLLLISLSGGNVTDFSESIPKKILDWQATGRDMTYDRKTLFDYMDGGAEVYLAFDFKQAFVRKYQGPAKDEIALDIYDMGSANEAFGIFSCDRQDPGVGIGQESEYGPGLLRFHQGRYFVSITAAGDEKKAEKAILKLGKAVAPLLGPAGPLPALLRCLPETGLKKDRTSYFHSALNLNNRFFVSGDNILNLDLRTDCILSDYALSAAETAHLLIVRYPDESRAQAAYRSFCQAYLPQGATSGAAQAEDRTWTVAVVRTDFVAVVFKAPTKQYAERLLSAVRYLQP